MQNYDAAFYHELEKKWQHFVETGGILPGVRPEIAESWVRSRSYHVDIDNPNAKQLSEHAFSTLLTKYAPFIDVVFPIMERMHALVKASENLISLHTPDGVMLTYCGDEYYSDNDESRFVPGVKWDEQSIGTNGVSLAVQLRAPVQLRGAEHYSRFQHNGICSAAPIFDENGAILGVINMAGIISTGSTHTLGLVALAAFCVERQLALIHSYQLLNDTFSTISEGLIELDADFRIQRVNPAVLHLFSCKETDLLSVSLSDLISSGGHEFSHNLKSSTSRMSYPEISFDVGDKHISCNVSCTPTVINHESKGALLQIRESREVNTLVNHLAGNAARYTFRSIVTQDENVRTIIASMQNVARTDCTILLQGESGTGKELFAHAIHNASERKDKPFIAINCASLPHALIESELFGYEKGAFTGALGQGNPGKFELADGGTIFLDEIGELPLEIQAKLLRVLDTHRFYRIGGKKEKSVDVRVIAATNRNLLDEVHNFNFRTDLYYRINVLSFHIPPLRERPNDIALLADHFIRELNLKNIPNPDAYKAFSSDFIDQLRTHPFPGNVRELQNIILRAFYRCGNERQITAHYLNIPEQTSAGTASSTTTDPTTSQEDYNRILSLLRKHHGNMQQVADELGVSRATCYRKVKTLALNPKDYFEKD